MSEPSLSKVIVVGMRKAFALLHAVAVLQRLGATTSPAKVRSIIRRRRGRRSIS
jgi:hypothetical protein